MKKLEEEIRAAFKAKGVTATRADLSKAAAGVSKRYIEKAWDAAEARRAAREFHHPENIDNVKFPPKDQWIKENL
jgi:hypothetical protein